MARRIAPILAAVAVMLLSAAPTNAKGVKVKRPKITALTVSVSGRQIKVSAVISPRGGQTSYQIFICPESEVGCEPLGEGTVTAGAEPREVHAARAGEPSRANPYVVRITAENEAGSVTKHKRVK